MPRTAPPSALPARLCATPTGTLRVRTADRFTTRALGLLVGSPLDSDEGLLISPCNSIHTIGMRYAIDVVFLDGDACVLRVCPEVRAGRLRIAFTAKGVLELRAGVAARNRLIPGVRLADLASVLAGRPSAIIE